jgi:alanine-glyoxylate transaminase/(R)-3-amino-2-methylpropionate-pyruvate transaminase
MRTPESTHDPIPPSKESLLKRRQSLLLPSVTHYYREPLQIVRAQGQFVWDETGKRYLDAFGGVVTVSVGHNHPKITERLTRYIESEAPQHTTTLYLTEPLTDLAARLTGLAPEELKRAFFTNSGSEANELAILLARQYTKRTEIIALKHAYHGGTAGTLSLVGQHTWRWGGPGLAGISHATQPDCYRCPFGARPETCALECADDVEKTIQTTTSGEIAAFIAEPIQGVAGFVTPPPEYFKRVHAIVKKYGGLYISDEVQTGVGRTGKHWFGILHSGVVPDLLTMAKGLGNGTPIAGGLVREEIAQSLQGKIQFSTFGGNPWSCLQADETLRILEEDENILVKAERLGARLIQGLRARLSNNPIVGDIRGRGLMVGIELVQDRKSKAHGIQEMKDAMEETRARGLLIGKGGLLGNCIRLSPPMCVGESDIDEMIRILGESLDAVAGRQPN